MMQSGIRSLFHAFIWTVAGGMTGIALAQTPTDIGDCPTERVDRLEKGLYRCDCEARPLSSFSVTGSGEYSTRGSKICEAAVHAGVLKAEPVPGQPALKEGELPKLQTAGGAVTFEIIDSPALFKGQLRNGIRSKFSPTKELNAMKFVTQ